MRQVPEVVQGIGNLGADARPWSSAEHHRLRLGCSTLRPAAPDAKAVAASGGRSGSWPVAVDLFRALRARGSEPGGQRQACGLTAESMSFNSMISALERLDSKSRV